MSYDAALTHPFHPKAKGARVPDEFVFPTTVYSTTVNYTVNCDSAGNADFLVLPNPFIGLATSIAPTGAGGLNGISNGPTPAKNFAGCGPGSVLPAFAGACVIPADVWPVSAQPPQPAGTVFVTGGTAPAVPPLAPVDPSIPGYSGQYCAALDQEKMRVYMSSWRLVGMGIRVRSLPSPQTQSGQFQVCTVPCPDVITNPDTSQFGAWLKSNSFPVQTPDGAGHSYIQASLIQYPASDMYMFAELTREGGLEWISRRAGSRADQFKGSFESVSTSHISRLSVNAGSGVITNTGTLDVYQSTNVSQCVPSAVTGGALSLTAQNFDEYGFSCAGWSAFFCRMSGLPPSAAGAVAPVVNVEVVYHLEGQPTISDAGGLVPNVAKGIYDHTYFTMCCMKATAEPWFRRVIDYDRFTGRVVDSNAPLQVAMAGLLGSQRPQKISSKSRGLKRRFY